MWEKLGEIRQEYQQVIVFTQYTDTMDFLRQYLIKTGEYKVICFSGRGGELAGGNNTWRIISRDEIKRIFKEGKADILLWQKLGEIRQEYQQVIVFTQYTDTMDFLLISPD